MSRQQRAESLARRFRSQGRKPIVLEFSGVPKAGKTTTLGQLQAFLKRCGFRVETVIERASVCPIRDKKHANFNVWTSCTTLAQLLEKTQTPPRPEDPDVLILDRGVFDSICWLTMMERLSRLRHDDLLAMEQFLRLDDWRKRISAVFVMIASPKDSLDRERGYLPVDGSEGSIMNEQVLEKTLSTTLEVAERLRDEFRISIVDTSSDALHGNPRATAETVADLVLDLIEEQLQEEILHLPTAQVTSLFGDGVSLDPEGALELLRRFATDGAFLPRDQVEADANRVQALPAVVVRNKSGEVLRLRRNEADENNLLHKKLVIWAGGHVRSEDGGDGEAVPRGALRELQEELRLSVEEEELHLLGAIYVPSGERTSKHVAIVYEWQAGSDDVAVALSNAEFFERRGNSLSGKFVDLAELVDEALSSTSGEVWSREIIREFLAPNPAVFPPRLF